MSKESARAWLLSALADLKSMERIMGDNFLTHVVAFHGQQCVEKCFKAILENAGDRVPKDHSTLRLYNLVKDYIKFEIDFEILTDFDDMYIDARYPGDFGLLPDGKPDIDEAQEFLDVALFVFKNVCATLQIDVQSE